MVIPPRREARATRPTSPLGTGAADAPPHPEQRGPFPTRDSRSPIGPLGAVVHVLFRLFEFAILVLLVPIRAVATGLGRLLVFLVQLPFRLVGIAAKAIGVVFVVGMVALVLFTALALFGLHPAGL